MDPLIVFMVVTLCLVGVVFGICITKAYRSDTRYDPPWKDHDEREAQRAMIGRTGKGR